MWTSGDSVIEAGKDIKLNNCWMEYWNTNEEVFSPDVEPLWEQPPSYR